jgi:Tfp pilus assembly protein PilX
MRRRSLSRRCSAYLSRTLAGRIARGSDSGATLIVALILITVVALVTGSVLFFAGSSVRTTVQLRNQASAQYQASNAMNAAIEKLRSATPGYDLGCGNGAATTVLSNVPFPAVSTAPAGSYAVSCTLDTTNTQSGFLTTPNAGPGTAMLALGGDITVTNKYKNGALQVDGGVFASGQVNVTSQSGGGPLTNVWTRPAGAPSYTHSWVIGRTGAGSSTSCTNVSATTPSMVQVNCAYGTTAADIRGLDPGTLVPDGTTTYSQPTLPSAPAGIGACANNLLTVTPGYFTAPPTIPACTVVHFAPGTYYFNFTGTWAVPAGYFIAGTLVSGFDPTKVSSTNVGSQCIPPDLSGTAQTGVEFVFGPNAGMNTNSSKNPGTNIVICSSPAAAGLGGPPVAIYGIKGGTTGSTIVSTGNCPKCSTGILGTIYAPTRDVNITMNNASVNTVAYGIMASTIEASINASSKITGGVMLAGGIPQGGGSPIPANWLVLTAYVCPGSATCSASSGTPALTAKVVVSGYLQRSVNVISWSPSS